MERNKELHQKVNEANRQYDLYLQDPKHLENKNFLSAVAPNFFATSTTKKPQAKQKKAKPIYWIIGIIAFFLLIAIFLIIFL